MKPEEFEKIRKDRLDDIRKKKENRHQAIIDMFNNLQPFNGDVDRIPTLPILSAEEYNTIVVPNLIRCGAIPKDKLIKGKTYIGNCRNSNTATWNGMVFEYQRYKFGMYYDDTINHFQDDDGSDLFIPIAEMQ